MTKSDRDKKIENAKKSMKNSKTHKPFPIWHKEEVVDQETGELIDLYRIEMEERDANFHKIWLWHLAAILDLIGNQKIKILSYILDNVNSDNLFIGTMRGIAEKTETSTKTVNDTVIMLVGANILIRKQAGVYLVNPEAVFRGRSDKRLDILYQYHAESKKKKEKSK